MKDSSDTSQPVRIQRQRTKGWKMPDNTIYVGRPSKWQNPFPVTDYGREQALHKYARRLSGLLATGELDLSELRGKNLACWCKLEDACHADILLERANR